ncbi:MAG: hypothetical protein NDJ89_01780 [Oligoflexia bacterium]|nr:hypothetical protein [Oligoflexia bacterium]
MNLIPRSRALTSLAFFLLSLPAWAAAPGGILYRAPDGKSLPEEIVRYQGTRVSHDCARAPERCKALSAHLRKPAQAPARTSKLSGHPANDLCVALSGKPVRLLDSEKNQRNFCEFEDRSLIDSWQLLKRAGRSP